MNKTDVFTAERIEELKKRPIDFSDIPEMTDDEAIELKLRNSDKDSD